MKGNFSWLPLLVVAIACTTTKDVPKYEFGDNVYKFKQRGIPYKKVYVNVKKDTVEILPLNKQGEKISVTPGRDEFFYRQTFDVDVLIAPFKFRPRAAGFPRQLNTSFNGNIFIGYRVDKFRVHLKSTPIGTKSVVSHRGISVGGFGGIGSAFISPWTTNFQTTDEYDGFVLTRGLAVMGAINSLTVGFGIGWDYLTDRDKNIWIYQNKPWLGVTLSLNIN